ncbi:hypothetical protein Nepgr_012485 [Nepenthes gracilis]|uniref:Uncharacterized protein n=1 Tax=Nepenthes gracilis TaxID=150966 RepID=A0AAD3SHA9_NEPGR|nr:hypothetical protein Nepgr_012485 [Nepenthes gracilis]
MANLLGTPSGPPRLGPLPLLPRVASSKANSNSPLSFPLESAALADANGRDPSNLSDIDLPSSPPRSSNSSSSMYGLQKEAVVIDCSTNPFAPILADCDPEIVKDLDVQCPQATDQMVADALNEAPASYSSHAAASLGLVAVVTEKDHSNTLIGYSQVNNDLEQHHEASVQDDSLETMAPDFLEGKVVEDITQEGDIRLAGKPLNSCQTPAVL